MTGTAEALADAVGAASIGGAAAEGVRHKFVPILRTQALLGYRLNEHEVTRRQAQQLGSISSPDVLDLLMDLPLGLPVPIKSLTLWERSALRSAPPGAVSIAAGEVTREAVAPVAVDFAIVPARTWRAGLETAGRFAPFCMRIMVLNRRPRNESDVRVEASFYGVGVVVADQRGADVLAEPALFRRRRFTVAGWQFLENVYQRVA